MLNGKYNPLLLLLLVTYIFLPSQGGEHTASHFMILVVSTLKTVTKKPIYCLFYSVILVLKCVIWVYNKNALVRMGLSKITKLTYCQYYSNRGSWVLYAYVVSYKGSCLCGSKHLPAHYSHRVSVNNKLHSCPK